MIEIDERAFIVAGRVCFGFFWFVFFNLFLIIRCTMASVVRPFPLSTIRRIPLLRGSWTSIKQAQVKTSQIAVMHQGWGMGGLLQRTGQIRPCPDISLSSRDKRGPPVD